MFIGEVDMAVLNFRPHTLLVREYREGYVDQDGHRHPGIEEYIPYMECDVIPASTNANIINYQDGRSETYDYEVILSTNCRDFAYGELVRLSRNGIIETTNYKVKWSHRYQLQYKLKIGYDGN